MYHPETAVEFRRRRAVKLVLRGEPRTVISRILGVSIPSISVWTQKAKSGDTLKRKPRGRPRRLSNTQLERLRELLEKGAAFHGWKNNLWTTPRVGEVIKRNFGIEFCRSGV